MAIFKMHNIFFVFLKCTIGGGQKVDLFFDCFFTFMAEISGRYW